MKPDDFQAKIILASKFEYNEPLIINNPPPIFTIQTRYPRMIHSEMKTHRVFSANSRSSRAVPTSKLLKEDIYIPHFMKNKPGMQPTEEFDLDELDLIQKEWVRFSKETIRFSEWLSEKGVHKQWANRPLEWFGYIDTLITSTKWDNFFSLRINENAQDEIFEIASVMDKEIKKVIETNSFQILKPDEWHIPFILEEEKDLELDQKLKLSVARCARISYSPFDGNASLEKEFKRYELLKKEKHHCYDDITEVLTNKGWKLWKDVIEDDKLLAVDIKNNTAKFELPSKIYKSDYIGEMINIESQHLNLCVTPNHNLVVSTRKNKKNEWTEYKFLEAKYAEKQAYRNILCTNLQDVSNIDNPFNIKNKSAWISLVGFFIGDGHANRLHLSRFNEINFHLKRQRKIDFIKVICEKCNLELIINEKNHNYKIKKENIGLWFRNNCYNILSEKIIPKNWEFMGLEDWNSLKIGLLNSDGSIKKNSWVYSSTSKILLKQIQTIAHLNMEVANYKYEYCGTLNFSKRLSPRIENNQKGRCGKVYSSHYEGKIYCASVSTGALLVRRNMLISVSGNSPFEHQARRANKEDVWNYYQGLESNLDYPWVQYRKLIELEEK